MKVETSNGFYMPSYFSININSYDDLDLIISNHEQTFIHEYLHFLQDIILPYCIRSNMTVISQFGCINTYAIEHNEITRPFEYWNEDCKITMKQLEYTWGCNEIYNLIEILGITKDFFTLPTGQNVYKYTLDTNRGTYQLGAKDFLEYIAHNIETKHWSVHTVDFPYRTIDKLFEFYNYSDIPTEVRMSIAEFCLYNDNPMHTFLEFFINQHLISHNRESFKSFDTCKQFLLNLNWQSKGGFNETIFSKTKRRLNDFRDWLGNQYKHKQFMEIKKWIMHVNTYVEINLSNKLFFSELFTQSRDEFSRNISFLVNDIGIPLIFNSKEKLGGVLPNEFETETFIQFYVMLKFMNYVTSKKNECPILQFCIMNTSLSKETCIKDPFIAVRSDVLCPFSIFIKSYGFHEVEFR